MGCVQVQAALAKLEDQQGRGAGREHQERGLEKVWAAISGNGFNPGCSGYELSLASRGAT